MTGLLLPCLACRIPFWPPAPSPQVVLKGVVKQFFNEKEVTSTLVMDALYAGCRQLEETSRAWAAVSRGGQL